MERSESRPRYEAVFERDDNNTWLVTVPQIKGAHTDGANLERARANIKEALALILDVNEDSFDLDESFTLPPEVVTSLETGRTLREFASITAALSMVSTREAVDLLVSGLGLSFRDTAHLVGISFQRVQQLRKQEAAPTPTELWELMGAASKTAGIAETLRDMVDSAIKGQKTMKLRGTREAS